MLNSRFPLFISQFDVLVSNGLPSSMFCEGKSSLSNQLTYLFQDFRQLFRAFVADSSSAWFSDETVNRGDWDDSVFPCSWQTSNAPPTAICSLDMSVSPSNFFKNFVLSEIMDWMRSILRNTFLSRSRVISKVIDRMVTCPHVGQLHERFSAPRTGCWDPLVLPTRRREQDRL